MIKLLSKNIVLYGGTNALKSLVPLLMLPILTAHLTLSDFGVLSIVETTILFVTPFIMLNINAAINVEYFKLEHVKLKEYVTNALILSLLAFMIVITFVTILREQIALFFDIDTRLIVWIIVFAMLRVVSSVLLGLYQSRQEATHFAFFTLSQTIFDFALSYILVVIYQFGYIGRLEGIYGVYGILSIIGVYLLIKMDYIGNITFRYTKDILNYGVPLIPHAVSGTVMAMSDRYFISYYVGNDEVGLYTIAYQISALMLLISMSVNQAWSPMLFKLLKEKNIQKVMQITVYLFIMFTLIGIIIYFLQGLLFQVFVDENFYQAKEYFGYLLIGFIFQSFYFLVTNILFFEKKTKLLASMTIIGASINIVLNYFFIQWYSVIGVAYATAITWFLFFLMVLLVDIKLLKGYK
jgi:O-antigen/teichoic acid export membrane protein